MSSLILFPCHFSAEFGGQVYYTNLGITPSGDFFRPGPPECPRDGNSRLSNDYLLWDQISKAPAQVTVADFHQRLAEDYYQDLLMGYRAVASFDIDQVVPPGKHRQFCGVGRVPHFQSKFNDVPAWVHPDFNLFSQAFLTKLDREGLRLPAPAVLALPPPPSREDERVSSSRALPSTTPVSREVASFRGLPLAGMRKERKQRENPRSVVVASPLLLILLRSIGSSKGVTTHQLLLLILLLQVTGFYRLTFICL